MKFCTPYINVLFLFAFGGWNVSAQAYKFSHLTSDDGLAPVGNGLATAVRELGNARVTTRHEATDHSWSDKRLTLESAVVAWLQQLR